MAPWLDVLGDVLQIVLSLVCGHDIVNDLEREIREPDAEIGDLAKEWVAFRSAHGRPQLLPDTLSREFGIQPGSQNRLPKGIQLHTSY